MGRLAMAAAVALEKSSMALRVFSSLSRGRLLSRNFLQNLEPYLSLHNGVQEALLLLLLLLSVVLA